MRVACLYFEKEITKIKVAELCLRLIPQICIGNSSVFIEIGKCYRLYSEAGFLARVQVILRRLGVVACIAIGDDISESFVMAKFNIEKSQVEQLPLTALIDFVDPLGRDLVLQKNVSKMIVSFSNLGIATLFQFKKIPLPELINRFGAISILCMQRLRQETAIPWLYWKPEEVIFEKSEFPFFEFYGELEPLLFKLKEQLDCIFQRLWARNLRVQKLQVRVFCETNSLNPNLFRHFEFEFITPQSTTKATLNILKERLAKDFERNPVRTPIEALETKVLLTAPGNVSQKNLLHNHEEQLEQFHALLGQLAETHGQNNIFHAELTEDRRPEKSWKKLENYLLDPSQAQKNKNLNLRIPLRPTHLLRPEKVQITAGYVHIRKKRFKILKRSEFVERISGGWVEQSQGQGPAQNLMATVTSAVASSVTSAAAQPFDRNYYQLELEDAPTISVFETSDKQFYLHGYYG